MSRDQAQTFVPTKRITLIFVDTERCASVLPSSAAPNLAITSGITTPVDGAATDDGAGTPHHQSLDAVGRTFSASLRQQC
ncbi:hypothetical protein K461DRAFT_81780 [Myriangium duriaei CBS 260.36]|uniref:Uncharacterized protein n=1 Tax=Myriangium duriaei CBS 260.36 TaxID=1168546 RepID=A0A9P4J6V1_9PEZI|nr:hypothetical protein K461DRAFT_81780 [Myriangium duriaei CBS 260.36]